MSAGGINNRADTGLRVNVQQSVVRQTPKTGFGDVLQTGLSRTGDAVMSAANLAAPFVPGGAVVSAAITGMGSLKSAAAGQTAASSGGNSVGLQMRGGAGGASGASGSSSMDAIGQRAAGGDAQAQMMMATREMQEMNQSFNLQYLGLQQKMQNENRQFTTLSNVMKTKHDTAKNAINNVR